MYFPSVSPLNLHLLFLSCLPMPSLVFLGRSLVRSPVALQEQLKATRTWMDLCSIEMAPKEMVSFLYWIACPVFHFQVYYTVFVHWSVSPSFLQLDSDSDSELSVDEHSSSYASSHSSDSEDDDIDVKPKWNNERPLHSTPKGKCTSLLKLQRVKFSPLQIAEDSVDCRLLSVEFCYIGNKLRNKK